MAITWRSVTAPGQGAANAMAAQAASSISDSFDGLKDTFQAPKLEAEAADKLAFEQALATRGQDQEQQSMDQLQGRFDAEALAKPLAATALSDAQLALSAQNAEQAVAKDKEKVRTDKAVNDKKIGHFLKTETGEDELDSRGKKIWVASEEAEFDKYTKGGAAAKTAADKFKAGRASYVSALDPAAKYFVAQHEESVLGIGDITPDEKVNFMQALQVANDLGMDAASRSRLMPHLFRGGYFYDEGGSIRKGGAEFMEAELRRIIADHPTVLTEANAESRATGAWLRPPTDAQKVVSAEAKAITDAGNAKRAKEAAIFNALTPAQKKAIKAQEAMSRRRP